jgi:ABC-type transporter Mla MlaB component
VTDACALPAELTIYTVGESMPMYLNWLQADAAASDTLNVDASAVAEVDAAGVQLLISLANGLVRRDRHLQLAAPSAALVSACTLLGADFLLADAPHLEPAA